MQKYLCFHTLGKNAISREQAEQLADALQRDPNLRGYRSFMNLSEGKVACIVESPDQQTLANWFQKNGVPLDWIGPVEFEGDRGSVQDARSEHISSGATGRGAYPA